MILACVLLVIGQIVCVIVVCRTKRILMKFAEAFIEAGRRVSVAKEEIPRPALKRKPSPPYYRTEEFRKKQSEMKKAAWARKKAAMSTNPDVDLIGRVQIARASEG
jgi:hypothetical protein